MSSMSVVLHRFTWIKSLSHSWRRLMVNLACDYGSLFPSQQPLDGPRYFCIPSFTLSSMPTFSIWDSTQSSTYQSEILYLFF
ncbi:hypothetical protein NPIL_574161, partial [Nephila pilipes]